MTLDKLGIGKNAVISAVECDEVSLRKHILDMGLTPGTEISLVKTAPMGDPLELSVRGYSLTLRKDDAANITIENIHDAHSVGLEEIHTTDSAHPMVGEDGYGNIKYKTRREGRVIPEGAKLSFALAGNQNCGKTTLFNQLTGSNQHVGNFPGVTIDRKSGEIRQHPEATVTDLPGIYSLSPYTSEEIVTREFILNEKPNGIINILDATNIERNMYLTLQLIELNTPMVVALNMMDELTSNGGSVDINQLEMTLGVPVVPISAMKNEGIEELVEHAVNVARYGDHPGRLDFCDQDDAVHRCIHALYHLIEDHARNAEIPGRFAVTKIIEGDELVYNKLAFDNNEKELIEHIILQLEEESGQDRMAALADMRFKFIERLCQKCVKKPKQSRERLRSEKMDRILTGKYTAIPAFIAVMAAVFYLTFSVFGAYLSDLMESGIDAVTVMCDAALTNYGINEVVHSLIIDGVFAGVGSVLSFLPNIVVLFFFLSILEDSGYMARIAFIMDKPLRKVGLSGRSFVPMLMGFGCSVPAIMATRTLPSDRDRKMTIMLTPFMSCSAKIPIYMLFSAVFFPDHMALVMVGLYVFGILTALLFALILKQSAFTGEPVPFVMELPNYRLPTPGNVMRLLWDKAKDFITRAFTVIFVSAVIIWFLQTFDTRLNVVENSSESLLAGLGGIIAHLFAPLNLGDWRICTALITGFMAKESVVSTLTVLLGGSETAIATLFAPFTAFVFLVFCLLYTPCVAAIASVKRELGGGWAFVIVVMQCVIAWIMAFMVHTFGLVIGLI